MYYIGQTWQTLKERFNSGCGYKGCAYLNNAIKKHGKNNFYYEILTVCSTQEMANYWEDYFIKKYDSQNPKKGYNLKEGGQKGKPSAETILKMSQSRKGKTPWNKGKVGLQVAWNKGKPQLEETKQKISNSLTGTHYSEETKLKRKDLFKGENNPFYGKTHSNETRQQMSQSKLGNKNRVGTKHTETSKKKMSDIKKQKFIDKHNDNNENGGACD